MGIINNNEVPNKAQTLAIEVARQKGNANALYRQIVSFFSQSANFVWNNKDYTPQEIFNAYGTDSAELVKLSAAAIALITAVSGNGPTLPPQGFSLTINQDGTVTVNQT